LILDEPTSALGVKEAAIVLRHVVYARRNGTAIILVTHNVQHALPVGDRFMFLAHGRHLGTFNRGEIDEKQVLNLMGGGPELEQLQQELRQLGEIR
jgi:simple sugar transport system ATP-binding protein